ncbi:MAG TPA: type II toxin-antitoxin system Phd/YefM family antitoxin [Silvibacterium sp.]|jgi:prevent-host-death family protein|nr:type II toxin-antitoxin system Phd/YefM family antitoxin [Silvibacterium sp.]
MAVNIHHAKTHLSKLIAQAENGEEVIIARNGKPVVKLVPVAPVKRKSLLGALKGKFTISDDFHLPDPEIEDLFHNSALFPEDASEKKVVIEKEKKSA